MTVYRWDKTTPANNASADATINWTEGQSPSTVNDSARAMMTAVAKYRDDIAGRIATTGTSTAYLLTTNQVFASLALMDGAMLAIVPNVTCSTPVTLNVDGLGAKPLRSSPGVELVSGMLIAGTPYAVTYNNSSAVWYVQNILGNFTGSVPIGAIMPYVGSTAPSSNFAICYGQTLSRTTYATLFSICSTTYNTGGEAGTDFRLPDLRGRVIACLDNLGGSAASRITSLSTDSGTITGTTIGSTGGSQSHSQTASEMAAHSHSITDVAHSHTVPLSATANTGGTPSTLASTGAGVTTSSNLSGITGTNSNGAGTAMAMLQPTIMLGFIIRVL